MNEKKMTAVEWLYFELWKQTGFSLPTNLLDNAKEMEKQQAIENMDKMQIIQDVDFDGNVTFIFNPEQYYKETYER